MTKQNREAAYKHFRDLESNYEALSHLNKGITETRVLRARAKVTADMLLKRNPELSEFDVEIVDIVEPKKKTKKISKEE